MKTKTYAFIAFLSIFLARLPSHAGEQDNWYLANEWSVSGCRDIDIHEDPSSGTKQIYVLNKSHSSSQISVYDMNGSLIRDIQIANKRYQAFGIGLDDDANIYIAEEYCVTCLENNGSFKWRAGRNSSINSTGSPGGESDQFSYAFDVVADTDNEIFVADRSNHRVQVVDKNGTIIRNFGSYGTAPGQLDKPIGLCLLPDSTVVVGDENYLSFYQQNGTFLKRENANSARKYVSISEDGTLLNNRHLRKLNGQSIQNCSFISSEISRTCFTSEGDIIESFNNKIKVWKRAYRTKGLPVRNVIPQPAVRAITQRAGTNIIDLDFEIIDPDDANATVGILAAVDGDFSDTSKWILPKAWVDGTGSKIGSPLATNQVHRVSWNAKADWSAQTGDIQFEILCQDGRTTNPVDLHFLTLPLADGNLTISRSPLKDSDFVNSFKYLLSKGTNGIHIENNSIVIEGDSLPANSTQYFFTNAEKEGRNGPTLSEVNASYANTNLEGNIVMSTQGVQEWIVPITSYYLIEAAGAQGGRSNNNEECPGYGSYSNIKLYLQAGERLSIIVGQKGSNGNGPYMENSSGGGGSFVFNGSFSQNPNPILVAGGGGGVGKFGSGHGGSADSNGTASFSSGGSNGQNGSDDGGGTGTAGKGIIAILSDPNGSNGSDSGGFGGGGETGSWTGGGGGGGYSGGGNGGSNNSKLGGGGGGSYFDTNSPGVIISNLNEGNGFVTITQIQANQSDTLIFAKIPLLSSTLKFTQHGKTYLMNLLGYRYATVEEVTKAREAATPGNVNQWSASVQVKPRNLPGQVNEYGFDTQYEPSETARYWWVVKE